MVDRLRGRSFVFTVIVCLICMAFALRCLVYCSLVATGPIVMLTSVGLSFGICVNFVWVLIIIVYKTHVYLVNLLVAICFRLSML
jgi:hypothetical protein